MKTKAVIVMGLVALGIVGQMQAQVAGLTEVNSEVISETPEPLPGLQDLMLGDPVGASWRVELNLNIQGKRTIWVCVAGGTPPSCSYIFMPPASIEDCGRWSRRIVQTWAGPCPITVPITYKIWMSRPHLGYLDAFQVGSFTAYPQEVALCFYRSTASRTLVAPTCSKIVSQ